MATVDFIPWATLPGANVELQAAYDVDPEVGTGSPSGIARSVVWNKLGRQASFQAAVIANFVSDALAIDVLDDGDLAGAIADFKNALLAFTSQTPIGSFVNKFRNATCQIAARPIPGGGIVVATGALDATPKNYTLDGWQVTCAGATVSVNKAGTIGLAPNSIQVTGQSGVTDCKVLQIIESIDAFGLANNNVLVQCKFRNNTGGAFAPTLTVKTAGSTDTWSSSNPVVTAQALQSVANGATGTLFYAFAMPSGAQQGVSVTWNFAGAINGLAKNFQLGDFDIRAVGAQTGSFAVVQPPPSLSKIIDEVVWCQRHLPSVGPLTGAFGQTISTGAIQGTPFHTANCPIFFPTTMRIPPTGIVHSAPDTTFNLSFSGTIVGLDASTGLVFNNAGVNSSNLNAISSGTTWATNAATVLGMVGGTGAYLYFTGAELCGAQA